MASLQSASACLFWARGTCVALQRAKRASRAFASAWSGISLASLTRQRPWSCSTISFESSSRSTSLGAQLAAARARARSTAVYSATLLVWTPRYSEIVAIGGASGRAAPGRVRVDQDRAQRRRAGVAARRAVGADDQPPGAGPPVASPDLDQPTGAPTDAQSESQPLVAAFSRVAPRSPRRPRGSPG